MMLRGLQIGILLLIFSSLWGQNAQKITANTKSFKGEKMACADQYAGTIQLGDINAQSDRIDLQDTTFLCYQDMFQVLHDGNADLTGDPDPSTTPGIGYLWYDCVPTIPGTNLSSIRLDACLIATPPPTNDLWAFVDDVNGDAKFSNGNNILGGNMTTVPNFFNGGQPFQAWFAPVTFDDAASLAFENSMSGEQGPCVNVNTNEAFSVVYLNPIEITNKNIIDLSGNPFVAQFEIEGGLPEFNGSNYTNIQILKSTNTFVRGTVLNAPYTDGDIVTFTVPEEGEYIITVEDGVSCGASEIFLISQDNDGILFDIGGINGASGDVVCVPFIVENFDSIEVFQFTINFDPNILSYNSFSDINLIGFDISAVNLDNVDKGEIRIIWIDPNLFEADGVSVADGEKLWDVCFGLKGTCNEVCTFVTITGSPLNIEVQNASSVLLETVIDPGQICITPGSALTICPSSCSSEAGLMQGSLSFSITGGAPPYNYSGDVPSGVMNMDGETVTVTGLDPGNYTVNVTDNIGTMTSVVITVRDSPALSIDSIFVRDPRCFGYADGRIRIEEVSGGNESEPYSYQWSNFLFNVTQLTDLPQGTYTVTVTDADGCTDDEVVILEANPLEPGVTVVNPATCDGVFDGLIRVRPTGGNPQNGILYNYNVQWENENEDIIVVSGIGVQRTIQNVGGTVNIQIGDANGCLEESSYEIPVAKVLSVQAQAQDILCFGENNGQIDLTAISQGDPLTNPVQFTLLDTFMTVLETAVAASDSHIFTDLALDSYLIELTDGDGCRADTTVHISEAPELMLDFMSSGLDCGGTGSDGKIVIDIEGGIEPYDILWEGGETIDSIENLTNGIYKVTVTDANLCMDSLSVDLTAGGNLVLASEMLEHNDCAGDMAGSITLAVQSNSTNIEYLWSNGDTTSSINMLDGGEYRVTISNDQGCILLDTFTINEPIPLSLTVNPDEPSCPGENGNLSIIVEGGTGNYSYDWDHPNDVMGATLPGIPAGDYSVTVMDDNNCPLIRNIVLNDPDSIFVDLDPANIVGISCSGENTGQATAIPSGGTVMSGVYNFEWSSGEISSGATGNATLLGAGRQWLLVNDSVCSTDSIFFDVPVADSIQLADDMNVIVNPSCNGLSDGTATVVGTGGDGTFSYNWVNDGQTGPTATDLAPGVHIVEITDGQGCVALDSIVLTEPEAIAVSINILDNVRCSDSEDGILEAVVEGGNSGDFQYNWSGSAVDSAIVHEIVAGIQTLTVTDSEGCSSTAETELVAPPPVVASIDNIPTPDCFGDRVCLGVDNASGGSNTGFTFQVNRGPRIAIDTCVNLLPGPYTITVLDDKGCADEFDIEIESAPEFSVGLVGEQSLELGDSTTITAMINGTAIVDSVFWNPIENLQCFSADCRSVQAKPVNTTTYQVLVTDINGCSASDEITIEVNLNRNVYIPNAFSPRSFDFENSELRIYAGSGVSSIEYFRIYDRWGNLIHEKENLLPSKFGTEGWDGKFNGDRVNPGVYVYFSKVNFEDGGSLIYKGSVTVL